MEDGGKNKDKGYNWGLIILFAFAFAVLFLVAVVGVYFSTYGFYHFQMPRIDQWGTIGDFVGGLLNPAFSFAALIVLLFTYKMQAETLRLTQKQLKDSQQQSEHSNKIQGEALKLTQQQLDNSKEELALTREELAKSSTALAEQSKTQELQRFENTFFQFLRLLIDMQNTIISYDLTIYQPSMYKKWDALNQCLRGWVEKCNRTTYPGSDVQNISISTSLKESFRFIYTAMKIDFFRIEIPNTMSSNGGYFEINIKDCIEDLALSQRSTLYYKNEFLLSYCQLLESVVDFVDVAQLECLDKERYIAVVRFQLTKDELAIIFYNALLYGPDGKNGLKLPKLKLLLEKYRLLRDVTENVLLDPSHIHLYREKPEAATP